MQFQVMFSKIKWIHPHCPSGDPDVVIMDVGGDLEICHIPVILAQLDTEDLEKELKRRKERDEKST